MGPLAARARSGTLLAATAWVVLATGLVVLVVGWWAGVDLVTRVHPSLVSMKANTAVGFILLGTGMVATQRHLPPAVATTSAALLTLLGMATVLQYASGIDLGIDQALGADTNLIATPFPGRMGLNTAIGFSLLGPALFLARDDRPSGQRLLAQGLVACTAVLSTLALLGYLLGVAQATGLGSATQMAVHTSLLFVLGCIGLAASTTDTGVLRVLESPRAAGRLARLLVPSTFVALLLVALSTEVLARAGLLEDPRLQLAYNVTLGMAALLVGTLALAKRLDDTERHLARTRTELVRMVSSMGDLYVHVDADDVVIGVLGQDHGLLVAGPDVGLPLASVLVRLVRPEVSAAVTLARSTDSTVVSRLVVGKGDKARTFEVRAVVLEDREVGLVLRDVTGSTVDLAARADDPGDQEAQDTVTEPSRR